MPPLGLVAVGDSIVNGHNQMLGNIPALSWAQWVADATDLPFTRYAKGGSTSTQIVETQLARVQHRYALGLFNMGTNDRLAGLDPTRFRENVETAAATLSEACGKVGVLTVPTSPEATVIVRDVASQHGITVIDAEVRGPRLLAPDGIHPTALGHVVIADRAAEALELETRPSDLIAGRSQRVGAGYYLSYGTRALKYRAKTVARHLLKH